ncbi:MAG: hypothetical protein H7123_02415 [Thermoleophilia bacterium]|nr:hypothetical protein [Thermoleophilia bacterium]
MNDSSTHPPEPTVASWGAPAPAAAVAGGAAAPAHPVAAGHVPAPKGRRARREAAITGGVAGTAGTARKRRFGGKWLLAAVLAVALFVVPPLLSSISNGGGVSMGGNAGGSVISGSSLPGSSSGGSGSDFSSYYGENINQDSYSTRWNRDNTTDANAYDGPYDYSGYGVDGMKARSKGAAVDPLYSDGGTLPDVFDQYGVGSADALNGAPATARGSAKAPNPVNPYYDPWAGQRQNPYQTRLDLSFGSASSRSAWLDGTDLG